MNKGIAAATTSIVVLIAVVTERGVVVAVAVICPDYSTAPVTCGSVMLYAVCAYYLTVNSFIIFIFVNNSSTVREYMTFSFFSSIVKTSVK